ncbi:uncharacterized protein LOC125046517 [Penaeus chinensis]|uniref:uncharacterized protein LOC125046517 n=1 Tax=Penaeus chinensis TaxID=139456 RepID=UPI001FB8584A|nr:uncharacterized protein LOC125046517 [Penaeus chinensis]
MAVQCYIIPLRDRRKSYTNIARIRFHRQDLPHEVDIGGVSCLVRSYRPLPRQCLKCWSFGHQAPPIPNPLLGVVVETGTEAQCLSNDSAQSRTCANCGGFHTSNLR